MRQNAQFMEWLRLPTSKSSVRAMAKWQKRACKTLDHLGRHTEAKLLEDDNSDDD